MSIFDWSYSAFRSYSLAGLYFLGVPMTAFAAFIGFNWVMFGMQCFMLAAFWVGSIVNGWIFVRDEDEKLTTSFVRREFPKHIGALLAISLVLSSLRSLFLAIF